MRTLLLRIVFAVYLVAVFTITWAPAADANVVTGTLATIARWLTQFGLAYEPTWTALEFLANIALFVPFGMLAMTAFRWMRVWSTTLASLATTCLIEGVQLFLPTRYSTVSDLIANTAGGLLGALAIALWRRIAERRRLSGAARRPS